MTPTELSRRAFEIAEEAPKESRLVNFSRIMELVQAAIVDARHEAFEQVREMKIPIPDAPNGWTF